MSDVTETAVEPDISRFALPRVIAVANQKGGVGKTTTAVNLGACIADLGYRTLIIDLDPQGNASTGLGIDNRNLETSMYDVIMHEASLVDCAEPAAIKNLFVAPASLELAGAEIELVAAFSREMRLRRAIEAVLDDYDFVLIDCPPSLGLLTVNGLAAAGEVLVPIQCEYYALEGLGQLLRNVDLVRRSLNPTLEVSTIICVMFDARTKLADQVVTEVREHFGEKVCRTVVPRTVRLSEAPSFGQPIITFDPTSRGAIAYRELAKEVSGGVPGGLGRGLTSLIPTDPTTSEGPELRQVAVGAIVPNPNQPRVHFDEESIADLAASIREIGVLQPILLRVVDGATDGQYQLIAGERRWRAARRAGLATVPAIVRQTDELASVEQALVENLHRQDLTALEEAAAFQQLIEDFGLTHDQVASRVGKSRSTVTNTIRLMQLPGSIQGLVADGRLSAGHARALLGTSDRAFQEQLARRATQEGWSVRAVEEAVRDREQLVSGATSTVRAGENGNGGGAPVASEAPARLRPPGLLELEELLAQHLDTRVSVSLAGRRGKMVVEFADLEDLERIFRRITERGGSDGDRG